MRNLARALGVAMFIVLLGVPAGARFSRGDGPPFDMVTGSGVPVQLG